MSTALLTTKELAARWQVAEQTLRQWRRRGEGPKYIKLGTDDNTSRWRRVRYRMDDILQFEIDCAHSQNPPDS